MKKILLFTVTLMLFFLAARQAQAALIWDWEPITPTGETVGPTDPVELWGRLYNDSDNGETISGANNTAYAFSGGYNSPAHIPPDGAMIYAHDNSVYSNPNHLSSIAHLINPGEYYDFIISKWTPVGSGAPEGNYTASHGIYLYNYTEGSIGPVSRTFSWHVGQTNVIPEPSTMILISLGGLVAFFRRKHG